LYAESGDLERPLQLLAKLTDEHPLYVNGWYNRALSEHRLGLRDAAFFSLAVAQKLSALAPEQLSQIQQLKRLVVP